VDACTRWALIGTPECESHLVVWKCRSCFVTGILVGLVVSFGNLLCLTVDVSQVVYFRFGIITALSHKDGLQGGGCSVLFGVDNLACFVC
jgi:hypothetical protein